MNADIYLHSSKENNRNLGVKLGLTGDALDKFCYACYEVKLTVEVDADGNATIVRVNDKAVMTSIKPIKRIDPLTGFVSTMFMMRDNIMSPDQERDAFRLEEKDYTIDTCVAGDTDTWETSIKRNGAWIIVEQYEDRERAEAGHARWAAAMAADPGMELTDLDLWSLNDEDR